MAKRTNRGSETTPESFQERVGNELVELVGEAALTEVIGGKYLELLERRQAAGLQKPSALLINAVKADVALAEQDLREAPVLAAHLLNSHSAK